MTTTSKRRRLQFGLRGLLIGVTALAVFLGWLLSIERSFVRDRRAFAKHLMELSDPRIDTDSLHVFWEADAKLYDLHGPVYIPWWRRWLGDDAAIWVVVRDSDQLDEARRLFPEADDIRIAERIVDEYWDAPGADRRRPPKMPLV